jgi:hypothetical protein
MKSKNFFMLINDLNNIHEFNILRYILWILSMKIASLQLVYFTMFMPIEGVQSLGFENVAKIWCE